MKKITTLLFVGLAVGLSQGAVADQYIVYVKGIKSSDLSACEKSLPATLTSYQIQNNHNGSAPYGSYATIGSTPSVKTELQQPGAITKVTFKKTNPNSGTNYFASKSDTDKSCLYPTNFNPNEKSCVQLTFVEEPAIIPGINLCDLTCQWTQGASCTLNKK